MFGLSLVPAVAAVASLFVPVDQAAQLIAPPPALATTSAAEANRARPSDGAATVLDARASGFSWGHLPGAVAADWMDFRDGAGLIGRIDADPERLARRLGALGVRSDRPVLVYGDAQKGFGEEGRLAWMLSYLGHPRVYILDGGIAAWRAAGRPLERGPGHQPVDSMGFRPTVNAAWRADKARVLRAARGETPEVFLLDVRTLEEWNGATPYLEARGGHIPAAHHLDWRELLDGSGRLLPEPELRARLTRAGVPLTKEAAIITYCTGGVRSALVWAALRSLGIAQVSNYDGSFWEWAADAKLPVAGPTTAPASAK